MPVEGRKQSTLTFYVNNITRSEIMLDDGTPGWQSTIQMRDWDDDVNITYTVRHPLPVVQVSALTIRVLAVVEPTAPE